MSNAELQSGSEGVLEVRVSPVEAVSQTPDSGHATANHADANHADANHADANHADANHADARKVSAPRWGTRMAALAVLLTAASCGSDRAYGNNGAAPVKADRSDSTETAKLGDSVETPVLSTQIQLQLNGGKKAGVALFHAENKCYDFRLISAADPRDVVKVGSKGEKVELLEGEFQNPTNGYKVEAFDKEGKTVEIGLSGGAAIYGPDRF